MIENRTLDYALITIGIFLVVIGCLLFYLIAMRLRQVRREQSIKEYIEEYKDVWYRYLVLGKDVERIHNSRVTNPYIKEAIDRILVTYVSSINNPDMLERISHFCSLNFKRYYRAMLYHRNWGIRMNGLYRALDFRLSFLLPDVEYLLKKKKYTSEEE